MAVGSGSIKRVQKAATKIQGDAPVAEEAVAEVKTEVKEAAPKKKAPAKKPAAKKAAPKKDVAKKDDIHEKKFEVVSNIKSDLPYYLL